jgi:hypothetical protein
VLKSGAARFIVKAVDDSKEELGKYINTNEPESETLKVVAGSSSHKEIWFKIKCLGAG